MGRGELQQYGHRGRLRVLTLEQENILEVPNRGFFITTASRRAGKQELAKSAGYSFLPPDLQYIAKVASDREDKLDRYLGLGVVAHHYRDNSGVPTTIQAGVNKAFAVHECFDNLRKTAPGRAIDLTEGPFTTHDNQRVLLKGNGDKVAFKKMRTSPQEQVEDMEIIIDTMKLGALNNDHVEFLSVFVDSRFGHPTEMAIKTVRTRVGRLLPLDVQTQLMATLLAQDRAGSITGGIDIDDLMTNFVDATAIDILVREYKLGVYHLVEFEGNSLMIVKSLVQDNTKDRAIVLPRDFNLNQKILPELVRGFTGSLI